MVNYTCRILYLFFPFQRWPVYLCVCRAVHNDHFIISFSPSDERKRAIESEQSWLQGSPLISDYVIDPACVCGRQEGKDLSPQREMQAESEGQCKCYCSVSSFDQSHWKVKRIQSGLVCLRAGGVYVWLWREAEAVRGLSYSCMVKRWMRCGALLSVSNAFRQQLALITFIDLSRSVPRI